MPPIPDYLRYGWLAATLWPQLFRQSVTSQPFVDSNDPALLRDLDNSIRGSVKSNPDSGGEQPPYQPPSLPAGLLGLILKYQQRSAISGDDGHALPAFPDQKPVAPDEGGRGSSDQPNPDVRRLERIDTTAGKERRSDKYSPPLVPNMPLDDDTDVSVVRGDPRYWRRGDPECEKEIVDATKKCTDAYRKGETLNSSSLQDCITGLLSPKCGGTKVRRGLTAEERARILTERVRRRMRGDDPDDLD
ncbi:hypothetical protein QA635_15140 [Bradyrhizobium brasilense]|uniref:hypothetical protein n=1 Tax=Bradyrhizobium brasilense TaxID=1419277 RepID=UPI0024B139B8|nr:hypothetical protein [Bradyrhizobium australafricanum]WFU35663.1 hypothetical protein QA635_15140 [Bradyrhizobium australafricanum]